MKLFIEGGPRCWNAEALAAYAGKITREETWWNNRTTSVMPEGQVSCEGCSIVEGGRGDACIKRARCTAEATLAVPGATEQIIVPAGELHEIVDGFRSVEAVASDTAKDLSVWTCGEN